jgi:hypothetical protein
MITSDREYQVTKAQLAGLEQSLRRKIASNEPLDTHLRDAAEAGIRSQIEELRALLAEYERLKGTHPG